MSDKRISPKEIDKLADDEVFVFGSNESGMHLAGAALTAKLKFGAEMGKGYGPTGKCFAIPTKSWNIKNTLPIPTIECFVARFYEYASEHKNKKFLVTKIGCGLAGYNVDMIAPLFSAFSDLDNVYLPSEFWEVIQKTDREYIIKNLQIQNDGSKNEISKL